MRRDATVLAVLLTPMLLAGAACSGLVAGPPPLGTSPPERTIWQCVPLLGADHIAYEGNTLLENRSAEPVTVTGVELLGAQHVTLAAAYVFDPAPGGMVGAAIGAEVGDFSQLDPRLAAVLQPVDEDGVEVPADSRRGVLLAVALDGVRGEYARPRVHYEQGGHRYTFDGPAAMAVRAEPCFDPLASASG